MKNIAIIPARSGSKRIKDKNIKNFNGKPLISYTINAAFQSNIFDKVVVSTDSQEYAQICRAYGADIPFLRSPQLASDQASSWDAAKEILLYYQGRNINFDSFALLQPTSPLRTVQNIEDAYNSLVSKNADAIVSVCRTEHSPLWCNTLPSDLSMTAFICPKDNKASQLLETYYRINGAIYMAKVDYFLEFKNIYTKNVFAYVMGSKNSIDIDTPLDFKIAEIIAGMPEEEFIAL